MTTTTIVDLRNKHRPGDGDIFDWLARPQHVYCGRPNIYRIKRDGAWMCVPPRGTNCKWGNPFKIGKNCTEENCLEKYEAYVLSSPELVSELSSLRGKVLGCWCIGTRPFCHTQVLARLADATVN